MMKTQYGTLRFVEKPRLQNEAVPEYLCCLGSDQHELGTVTYHTRVEQYVFVTAPQKPLTADELGDIQAFLQQLNAQAVIAPNPRAKPKVYVRRLENDEVVHTVVARSANERYLERLVAGLAINMDHDRFYIDTREVDG